jgi:hypothetical protein
MKTMPGVFLGEPKPLTEKWKQWSATCLILTQFLSRKHKAKLSFWRGQTLKKIGKVAWFYHVLSNVPKSKVF